MTPLTTLSYSGHVVTWVFYLHILFLSTVLVSWGKVGWDGKDPEPSNQRGSQETKRDIRRVNFRGKTEYVQVQPKNEEHWLC